MKRNEKKCKEVKRKELNTNQTQKNRLPPPASLPGRAHNNHFDRREKNKTRTYLTARASFDLERAPISKSCQLFLIALHFHGAPDTSFRFSLYSLNSPNGVNLLLSLLGLCRHCSRSRHWSTIDLPLIYHWSTVWYCWHAWCQSSNHWASRDEQSLHQEIEPPKWSKLWFKPCLAAL